MNPTNKAGVNIQVVVRCRPVSVRESVMGGPLPVQVTSRTEVQVQSKGGKMFRFDQAFDHTTSQEQLFRATVVPMISEVLAGFNCTIFAYGQTGTGKTHTMEGSLEDITEEDGQVRLGPMCGVIPRAVQQIFSSLERGSSDYSVKMSVMELYNEDLMDLLAPEDDTPSVVAKPRKLKLYDETMKKGPSTIHNGTAPSLSTCGAIRVDGLEEVPVRKCIDVMDLMAKAAKRRQIAETKLNACSSRSHMITTITVHIKETTETGEDMWKIGKLNLVDLAGSENIGRSGAQGKRANEAGMINQSLLTLGRTINALVENQPHVPYRESKLTRLLQDSLGGKTKTCIIATIAPTALALDETLSTLEYAQRAKSIRNKPEANQRMTKKHVVRELEAENEDLKRALLCCREKGGIYLPNDLYESMLVRQRELELRVERQQEELESQSREVRVREKQLQACRQALLQSKQRGAAFLAKLAAQREGLVQSATGAADAAERDSLRLEECRERMRQAFAGCLDAATDAVEVFARAQRTQCDEDAAHHAQLTRTADESIAAVRDAAAALEQQFRSSAEGLANQLAEIAASVDAALQDCREHATVAAQRVRDGLAAADSALGTAATEREASARSVEAALEELCGLHSECGPRMRAGLQACLDSSLGAAAAEVREGHAALEAAVGSAAKLMEQAQAQLQALLGCSATRTSTLTQSLTVEAPNAAVEFAGREWDAAHSLVVSRTASCRSSLRACAGGIADLRSAQATAAAALSTQTDEDSARATHLADALGGIAREGFHSASTRLASELGDAGRSAKRIRTDAADAIQSSVASMADSHGRFCGAVGASGEHFASGFAGHVVADPSFGTFTAAQEESGTGLAGLRASGRRNAEQLCAAIGVAEASTQAFVRIGDEANAETIRTLDDIAREEAAAAEAAAQAAATAAPVGVGVGPRKSGPPRNPLQEIANGKSIAPVTGEAVLKPVVRAAMDIDTPEPAEV